MGVQVESEVIEFRGCEFDGSVLVRGRFYFQNDFLLDGMIAPKRTEFLTWADRVFRLAKKSLSSVPSHLIMYNGPNW